MRAVSLHGDVIVVTSRLLHANCTIIRGAFTAADADDTAAEDSAAEAASGPLHVIPPGAQAPRPAAETFILDSPILPDELELLPSLLAQAGFPAPSGLLATHADWDHLLAPLAFPGTPLGCAEGSAARLAAEPGAAQRSLREFDEGLYISRELPLALGAPQALPVPGRLGVGDLELELHIAEGHTGEGMAVWVPWAGVLAPGDYLSAIEIPLLGTGGAVEAYLDTLERLRPLVQRAEHVVPGHGPIIGAARALEVLEEDLAYLRALRGDGAGAELPAGRRSREQRRLHAANAAALAATA
jgi:glyoxylase-like metal-dependent hydrolase (beta-lactamase superfamily II)